MLTRSVTHAGQDTSSEPCDATEKNAMTHIDIGRTKDGRSISLQLNLANRHGLVTGATGGGKTVTLQKLAEGFSRAGVPVFAADIKGDLSGIAAMGDPLSRMAQRAFMLDTLWKAERFPVRFWDLYGVDGIKIGTSVDEMGVNMMARILNLNETQAGVLNVLSHACRDGFFPGGPGGMRSLECIHAVCELAHDYTMELRSEYGHVTSMTIGMISTTMPFIERAEWLVPVPGARVPHIRPLSL
jgi:hypothetical protein